MEGDPRNPRVSLLRKYDIPVEHLSYEYVENCTGKKELERIIRILRSGEEGFYPDLLKLAEDRLRQFAPESRVLRVETPILTKESLTNEEWTEVEKEILSWEEEMTVMDKSLDFEKSRLETVGNKNLPAVRKVTQPETKNKQQQQQQKEIKGTKISSSSNSRIKSGDYAAWDKFDVDKELLRLDIEEERKEEENQKKKREVKKKEKNKIEIVEDVDKDSYSSMEQLVLANQAKDRGNECYKSGDLENARKYYDISIKLHPTVNAYNNRAMTYIKLKQYKSAVEDCNRVLKLEKNNVKALHRRATAYQNLVDEKESLDYNQLALRDLNNIVQVEPNNKVVQADIQKLKKKLNIEDSGKRFRLQISEIGSDGHSSDEERISQRNAKDTYVPLEKLPLTYYGPSTSTFQCEPYSMAHRTLSGSYIPGQVLCKCNSNRPRQNPLCQKCGEAMCTPKPTAKSKKKTDMPKEENKVEVKITEPDIDKRDSAKPNVNCEVSENVEINSGSESSRENLTVKSDESCKTEPVKQVLVETNPVNNKLISKENSETSQDGPKKPHKKKKKKEKKELKGLRKHMEPVKIVQSAKYLHPTSVEPKVITETEESRAEAKREMNGMDNTTQFKAFVPNKKCYIPEPRRLPPVLSGKGLESERSLEEKEGNKENILEDNGRKKVDSAFEFMKTWEELKKMDETFSKRAEIIRMISPSDLKKVIGIKLDSDMLSSLLECLERHFIDTEPKVVVEYLKYLPEVPRFGLVTMFLADSDRQKMKKLVEVAERKGFKMDDETKKNLTINS